jgi:hypothetical protein
MKNLYNSNKKNSQQYIGKISIAAVSTIHGHLSRHHRHKLLFHVV